MSLFRELWKLIANIYVLVCVSLIRAILPLVKHPKAQAKFIRQTSNLLSAELRTFNKGFDLTVTGEGTSYSGDGQVLLSNKGTDRYLKTAGSEVFAGTDLFDKLALFGISNPETIIDVGANFGEISLCFSKKFPNCRIIAIEPVSANLKILEDNLGRQNFDTSNIKVMKYAVSDDVGEVRITNHLGSQNSIVAKQNESSARYELVPTIRLDEIYDTCNIQSCDFLKIDIEGAEPGLRNGLSQVLAHTKCVLIEFSYKNTHENYKLLIDTFIQASDRWHCYDANKIDVEIPLDEVMSDFRSVTSRKGGRDYWFVSDVAG